MGNKIVAVSLTRVAASKKKWLLIAKFSDGTVVSHRFDTYVEAIGYMSGYTAEP